MNLNEFVNKYNGKIVRNGQCGELVRQYWIDVDQTNPPSYPNSKDYWYNDVPGYDKVHDPQPGNIAIYDGHGPYTEGHSAIYYDGRVFEQNADPDHSPAHLFNRSNTYLLGYLRKKGTAMGRLATRDDIVRGYGALFGRTPSETEIQGSVGKDFAQWFEDGYNSKEHQQYVKQLSQGFEVVGEQLYKKK